MQEPLPIATSNPKLEPHSVNASKQRPSSDKSKSGHLFVDNVRFWSMFGVIAVHATGAFELVHASTLLRDSLQVPFKFGTIGFFLISGFLLGERLQTSRPFAYFGRRVKRVFLPWLVWISLFVTYILAFDFGRHRATSGFHYVVALFPVIFKDSLLYTAFWFVPNLLLALLVLLVFRRYLYDLRFGAALLAMQLFYVVNIYKQWIPSSHLEALFGFVFDLWLGSYASRHVGKIITFMSAVRMRTMVAAVFITWGLAYGETLWLRHLGSPATTNTLRLTNHLFSIAVVLLLVKIPKVTWPSFINIRRDTFGLYLTHSFATDIFSRFYRHTPFLSRTRFHINTDAEGIFLWILMIAFAYAVSLLIVRVLSHWSRTRFFIGAEFPMPTPRKMPRFQRLRRFPALALGIIRTAPNARPGK